MNFRFINVVWGESYTDLLLTLALPCQLSPGNLGQFRYKDDSSYAIYTTSRDAEVITKSPAYAKLSQIMSTEIILIDDISLTQNKYNIVSECYKREVTGPIRDDTAFVILSPDIVHSDGTFAHMAEIAASGKTAVMVLSPVLAQDTFMPVLLDRFYSASDNTITISSRQLVELAVDHLHPDTLPSYWDSTNFTTTPSLIFWDVPNEGILARCFHLHPLMVYPQRKVKSFYRTIDIDYAFRACPNPDDIYIVQDSDEIAHFSVSKAAEPPSVVLPNTASELRVARWAAIGTVKGHRRFLRHKIRMHFNDVSPQWDQVELASDEVVDRILFLTKFQVLFLVMNWRWTRRRLRENILLSRPGSAAVKLLRLRQIRSRFRKLSGRLDDAK